MHLDPPIKPLNNIHHHKQIPIGLTQMLGTNPILITITRIPLEVGQSIVNLVINHQDHGQVTRTHQTPLRVQPKILNKLHHQILLPTVLTKMLGTNPILIPLTKIPL